MTYIKTNIEATSPEDYAEKTMDLLLTGIEYSAEERGLSPDEVAISQGDAEVSYSNGEVIDIPTIQTLDQLQLIHETSNGDPISLDSRTRANPYFHANAADKPVAELSEQFEFYTEIGLTDDKVEETAGDHIKSFLNGQTSEEYAWERMSKDPAYSTNLNFLSEYNGSENEESAKGMTPFTEEELDHIAGRIEDDYEFIDSIETVHNPGSQVEKVDKTEPSSNGEKVRYGLI